MHDPNYIKITTGLFIMLNPFVLIPVFLGLTGGLGKSQKMKVAFTCSIAVFVIMMISVFGGHHVLSFFGITINDFRIAGGLLIFLMAISMSRAKEHENGMRYSDKEHEVAKTKDSNIAVVPLAIPLMAGPAAISVSIIDAELCSTFSSKLILVAIIASLSLVLWVAMALAEQIGRFLGHTGQQVLTRVMGLILLALSIEFLVVGIKGAFHLSGQQ
jgi:multiple antibiotic resistance protein